MNQEDLILRENEIWRYLGYRPNSHEITPQLQTILQEQLREAKKFIKPQASYRRWRLADLPADLWQGESIRRYLGTAEEIIIFTVTISSALEEKVRCLFGEQQSTEAVILDAIGTEAVESAADQLETDLQQKIMLQAQAKGTDVLRLGRRYSPGYGDWSLRHQQQLLFWSEGESLGVRVNQAFMLLPQKSITAIIKLQP